LSRRRRTTYAISRRQRAGVITGCLLLAVIFVLLERSPVRDKWQPKRKSEDLIKARDFQKYHEKSFAVVRVVDGDTLDIDVPDGQYKHTRVRLWGIDTPETKNLQTGPMYFGQQAADFTTELTLGRQVTVYLDTGNRTRGKYGRLLAYVQLPDDRFLNEVLLSEGFAYADLRFRHSFYHKYQQLQAGARRQKKGLWASVTRGQLPEWLQRERPNLQIN
jgi:micrococcal nuclease